MRVVVIIQIACVPPSSGATAQFIVGRCITGVGNGINTSTIPTYQAEYVPFNPTSQGLLLTTFQVLQG
jgi:MFS family permease